MQAWDKSDSVQSSFSAQGGSTVRDLSLPSSGWQYLTVLLNVIIAVCVAFQAGTCEFLALLHVECTALHFGLFGFYSSSVEGQYKQEVHFFSQKLC